MAYAHDAADLVVNVQRRLRGSAPPPAPRSKHPTLPNGSKEPVSHGTVRPIRNERTPLLSYTPWNYRSPFWDILAAKAAQDMPPISRFISNSDELWKNANKLAGAHILDQTRAMNGSLDATLIFAGLFSAVNSTLIAISLPSLSPGASLSDVSQLLRLIASGKTTLLEEPVYRTPPNAVLNNALLSASLLFSLFAAFGAVVGKQWLIYYVHITPGVSDQTESEERRTKIAGAETWHLRFFLEMLLPGLLQISLTLFIVGIVDFFWNVNIVLALCTGALAIIVLGLIFVTTIFATIYPSCPFQTPLSKILSPALHAILLKTLIPNLPIWSATDISLNPGSLKKGSWLRRPRLRVRKERDFTSKTRDTVPHPEESIVRTAVFTVKMSDELTSLRPTLSAILSITSKKMMETLSKELGERLCGILLLGISQLHRQKEAGFMPETMVLVGLLSRVTLTFSLFGNLRRPDDWWSHFYLETESLRGIVPEISQLVHLTGLRGSYGVGSTPAPIHLAGALLRHREAHIRSAGLLSNSEVRRYARIFCSNANAALSVIAPWASLSMTVQGLRYILEAVMEPEVVRDSPHPAHWSTPNPPVHDMEVEKTVIWDIYVRNSHRQRSMGDQWGTLSEVFDAFSEELLNYLRDQDESGPWFEPALYQVTIWENLIKEAISVHARGGKESAYAFASSMAVFLRRADSYQRRNVQSVHGEELSIGRAMDKAETALRSGVQKWAGWSSSPNLWLLWVTLASKDVGEMSEEAYTSLVTLIGIDYGDPTEHRSLLNEFPSLVDALGRSLLFHPTSLAEATLWLLVRHGERWFDHDDREIHARFIGSNIASGIARTLALQLVRFPLRRPDLVLSEIVPLLLILLKHDVWVAALLNAFLETNVAKALSAGPSLMGSDPWGVDEAPLRQHLGLLVARAGTEEILGVWWSLYASHSPGQPTVIPPIWFAPDSLAAVESCIKGQETTNINQHVKDALEAYVDALDQLGDDRHADVARLRENFSASSQSQESPEDIGINPMERLNASSDASVASFRPRRLVYFGQDALPLPKIIRYPLRKLPTPFNGVRFNIPDASLPHSAYLAARGARELHAIQPQEPSVMSAAQTESTLRTWLGVARGYVEVEHIIPQQDVQPTSSRSTERSLIEAMGMQTPYIGT